METEITKITEIDLARFFAEQEIIFQKYSQMRKALTKDVNERPNLLEALNLENFITPNKDLLSDEDRAHLNAALGGVLVEGFYSKSTQLGLLDNLNTRKKSYMVTLANGNTFSCRRPEAAFQHEKLSAEAQQLTLREIYNQIDPTVKQEKFVNAFVCMMKIVGEDKTYSEAMITMADIDYQAMTDPDQKFVSAGTVIAWASRVRTTIPGYLREGWDERESRVAMAYSDLSVMLRSGDTLKQLMSTKGFLIEDTQRAGDAIWGFSSDFRAKKQVLDGKNYLGLIHTIFRNFILFMGNPENKERLFQSVYAIMPKFVDMMINLIDKVVADSK